MKLNSKYFIGLVLIFLLEAVLPVFAEPVHITVTPLAQLESMHNSGYFYYGFAVENLTSTKILVDVELLFEGSSRLITVKQVELAPHETKEEYMYSTNVYGYNGGAVTINFFVDGILEYKESLTGRYRSSSVKSVLVDNKISNLDSQKLFEAKGSSGYRSSRFESFSYKNNIELMPTNWVAYSQYCALMFMDSTLKSMPETVRNAIFDYVRAGGKLVVIGAIDLPEDARKLSDDSSSGVALQCSVGFGGLMFLRESIFNDMVPGEDKKKDNIYPAQRKFNVSRKIAGNQVIPEVVDNKPKFYAGKTLPAENVYQKFSNFVEENRTRFSNDDFRGFDVQEEFRDKYSRMASNSLLGLFILAFAIVLGPVNYWILNKKDKKILVFVTTPIIAFICCILVFGYDLFFESWRFDIFRQSITLLYQDDNTAVTCGNELFISGRSRNNCIEFPLNTIVIPFAGRKEYDIGNLIERKIKLENVQKYSENWVRAKCPLALATTSVKQSRARLEIKKNGDSIEILNGLGADARMIKVFSEDGSKMYLFENIKSGAVASPGKIEKNTPKKRNDMAFTIDYNLMDKIAADALKPGEYVAYLESNPFLAQEIDSKATMHELGSIVIGTCKGGRK